MKVFGIIAGVIVTLLVVAAVAHHVVTSGIGGGSGVTGACQIADYGQAPGYGTPKVVVTNGTSQGWNADFGNIYIYDASGAQVGTDGFENTFAVVAPGATETLWGSQPWPKSDTCQLGS